ncbi:putative bifunctional diguanylate cyclase/phosphodiesterase [Kineococcus auxinigenes]|uniref:putative bifunctional diguanylate cyclase/phosphodiesterase n=1 Tax=unclassified Kineococcus TaxID=2621656 RepID=UPI003D7C409D
MTLQSFTRARWPALLVLGAVGVCAVGALASSAVGVVTLAQTVLVALACGALVLRAVRVRAERAVWVLFATGASLPAVANVALLWSSRGVPAVRFRAADAHPVLALGALASYLLLYAAQVKWLRGRQQHPVPGAWARAVFIVLTCATVSAATLAPWLGQRAGFGTAAANAVAGRPLLDLLLVVIAVVHGVQVGWRADRRLAWTVVAFASLLVADVLRVARDGGVLHSPAVQVGIDTFTLGSLLVSAGAAWLPPVLWNERVVTRRPVLVSPAIALAAATGVLLWDRREALPPLAVHLAAVVLVGVTVSIVVVARQVMDLANRHRLALTDPLTGLGTTRALLQHLEAVGGTRGERGRRVALLVIDLHRFQDVNEHFGHGHGNDLLRQVATRLQRHVPAGAVAVRLGGDDFCVLLPDSGEQQAREQAEELRAVLAAPFTLAGHEVHVGSYLGIATWPFTQVVRTAVDDGAAGARESREWMELLRRAGVAVHGARGREDRVAVYDGAADRADRDRLRLAQELRSGIGAGELTVHYQPQVDLRTGTVVGMEALVRWQHPHRGLLAPAAFLDVAEDHGLMEALTTAVLHQAVHEAAGWHEAGHRLRIAVNLAASSLIGPLLRPLVHDVLAGTGLDPAALVLEITETTLMLDPQRSRATIDELIALGVAVSIDDYGTGYSSLAYLQDLPAVELKLDRSFTSRLGSDPRTAAIIASTADLAHSLGLRLLVEGVEDAATLHRLAAFGVDETQGYHHARPMPAHDVLDWLQRHEAVAVAQPKKTLRTLHS